MEQANRLTIIQTKGSLDWAYPSLILASTARTLDQDAHIFFSYYGIRCLLKDTRSLRVSPVGNPAMPIRSPIGPASLKAIDWRGYTPDLLWSLPGMTRLATWAFKRQLASHGQLPFAEMRELCLELGVKMTACQMSMELLGFNAADLIDGIEYAGAASYLADSARDQSLFI
ncbi:NADH dehydrogenase [Thiomicrospira aerophila AL3]|uniref:NADH dehydrogenase n=1 Tax=Thiomicrospira aerophila AL3 TaxID=717772 RepID=W0DTR5_9GAMM|nr:DsrE/DsrF/DrsH-like family protein [Thiomicrospira aerophila]AHF01832.1 NADH dehydrogenase [Thiomicrospira aerophila AL3]